MLPRFTANIGFLFPERPFLERIDAAKAAGFAQVECHYPYEFAVDTLRERLSAAGVELTGLNTAPGDLAAGDFGLAGVPGRETEFRRAFDQALSYAVGLGTPMIHVMAGVVAPNDRQTALRTYISNVRAAAQASAGTGITLLLEPINHGDKPDYLVSRSDEMAEIIRELDEPNVRMLFDAYHVGVAEGDVLERVVRHQDIIAHVQIAAVPSRAEPDEGDVDYRRFFEVLDTIKYRGLIGLEYKPRGRTEDGLGWMVELLGRTD